METPIEGEGAVASEPEKEDRWEAAEEAFEAAVPEVKAEVKVEKPESQVEPEIPDYLKLDDLRVPAKYKEAVKERLQKVVSDIETKSKTEQEKISQDLGQHKEAVAELVKVFQDIAKTPKDKIPHKIAEYVEQFGNYVGVDPSVAQSLKEQQQQVVQQEQKAALTIEAINKQFLDRMVATEDPREFRALWEEADLLKSQVMEQTLMGKVGLLLRAYHDQCVAPDKQTLREYKNKAEKDAAQSEFNSRKSSWDGALKVLKGKYSDFEKYQPQMSKMIREQKALSAARDALNGDSSDVESRQSFLENIYLAISRKDALENAGRPSRGGLPPSKHINTNKSGGGGNWDRAYENSGGDDVWRD